MYTVGMDIGGTNTVFGIVDKNGQVICTDSVKTQAYPVLEDYVDTVAAKVKALTDKVGGFSQIAGMGIGAPNGNYYKGTIEFAPNLPWKGIVIPLAKMFSERLGGMKVILTNDANAAALGEKMYGVGKDLNHFIVITLGTGVGSGIIIDGKLLYGQDGTAGELGHVIVRRNGRMCGCGRRGCLEAYCSATGLVRTTIEKLEKSDKPSLLREIDTKKLTSKDVYDAAVNGDKLAIEIFKMTGTILGEAMADMVCFSNPQAIVLFGGLAKAGDFIRKYAYEAMEKNMLNIYKGKTQLLISALKDADAAILGASALGW